jgi:N-acetylmuramoyl-L-alanine amidase
MNRRIFFPLMFFLFLSTGPGSRPVGAAAEKEATSLLPITGFADSLGYSWRWERAFRRLTCVRHPVRIRFYEDNTFYYVNGVVDQLPEAPVRKGAALCLSRQVLEEIFTPGGTVAPSADRPGILPSRKPGVNIFSALSEKKKNGTLLTITLADSLPMEVTYFFPNLTFNFYGGKLDTTAIVQSKRTGIIDSIFSHQFKESAQITALLVREIEEPMIDYVADTRTIMISLWPRKIVEKKTAPKKAAAADKKSLPKKKQSSKEAKRPAKTVIVIDPGHGGKDPGCLSAGGIKEKDVVLSIGKKLRDNLKKEKNITVYMTRDKDVFIPLADRTKFANDKKAHLFISIHADAIGGSAKRKQTIRGYKTYFLSQAKNEEDKLVAMRENAVIKLEEKPQNYSNLQNVLIEMAGNEYLRESQDLCILLDQTFSKSLKKKMNKLHRGVGQANFWVLNGAFMPSVLIETGFLSNKKEEKLLNDSKFQKEMAASMSEAVIEFCKEIETGQ